MTAFTQHLSTDAWNRPAIGLDTEIGQLGVLPEHTVHRARLEVCSRAVDATEARELLAMLGLAGGGESGRSEHGNTVRTEANRRRRVARAGARRARTTATTGDER